MTSPKGAWRILVLIALFVPIGVAIFGRAQTANPDSVPRKRAKPFHPTQPDYTKWQSITPGMDESDVIARLGEPLAKPDPFDRTSNVLYNWEYGYLAPKSRVFPRPLVFTIRFLQGKVFCLEDPFNGTFSPDGTPTVPEPIWPENPPIFPHYPRWIDLRWYPSSGEYPMRYEVEIAELKFDGNPEVADGWITQVQASDIPYLAAEFDGMGLGRWRVRAINDKGIGEWSDYHLFVFEK
jgi:hypothetical protein